MNIDTFVTPASSQAPLLLFWDWFAFFIPNHMHLEETECASFLSGMMASCSHGDYACVLLFVQKNVVPSGIWKLLPRMDESDDLYIPELSHLLLYRLDNCIWCMLISVASGDENGNRMVRLVSITHYIITRKVISFNKKIVLPLNELDINWFPVSTCTM